AGVAAFVATAAGHDLGPDEVALAQTLHRETEGNPFFLREILHHLFDAGVLDETSGRWRVQLNLADIGIHEGVREVVGRRLSTLSPETNRTLSVAAVVGHTFSFLLLERVAGVESDELLDILDEAVEGRVIGDARDRPGSHAVSHSLLRQLLLAQMPRLRRAPLRVR